MTTPNPQPAEQPKRIQLRRSKGWRKPDGAVVVSRPSKWGNPFKVYLCDCCGHWDVLDDNGVPYLIDHARAREIAPRPYDKRFAQGVACDLFEHDGFEWFGGRFANSGIDVAELRGKDLACWCKPTDPCHADVLLRLANRLAAPLVLS